MTNNDKKDLKLKKYLETCTGKNILFIKKNLLFMGFVLGKNNLKIQMIRKEK